MSMRYQTVHQLSQGLAAGEYSSVELTKSYLDRIDDENSLSLSFLAVDHEGALAAAAAADQARANGETGPLCGVPVAHKDVFCTKGLATTCASHMLESFVAPYDATVVSKLRAAGAVMLGKTNMDEFAMGSSNENSYFGAVTNPWGQARVPGGSSGGSAAAVAAGLTPIATGTDTGGSIRQPAAFCGVTGLKPTYGRVSRYGMIAFASSLDQGGPLALDARDAGLLLHTMAGFDASDSTSAQQPTDPKWLDPIRPEGLTIGLPTQYYQQLDDAGHLERLAQWCREQGHTCVEVSLPHTDAAIAAYYVISGAEASTNLSRYDGVRFGHRCTDPQSLEDLYQRSRSEGFGDEVKRRILTGTYALSVGYYDAYYLKAQQIRRLIANDFAQAFSQVDVLLAPTTPGPAFAQNALTDDPVAMYQQDIFTVPVSLAGLPAISIPWEQSADGLPLAAQLIAAPFREDVLLNLACAIQSDTDWHLHHPEDLQ